MVLKLPDIITEEELIKIIQATKKPHHKVAFMLGFYESMRVSEVVKLRQEDIDKNLKQIRIVQGKGGKDAIIPLSQEVIKVIKYIPIGCGVRALEIKFKQISKQVLNKDLHFHTLRHSGITHYLVKKKWSSLAVQQLARHSKITTTEIYSHFKIDDLINLMWNSP